MEIAQLAEFADAIPVFAWVIVGFFLLFLFGDRKYWEFEAKFPLKQGVGRGGIEIERYKKRGTIIEVEFTLEPDYRGKAIEVLVADELALIIPAANTRHDYLRYVRPYALARPEEGARVTVNIDGESHFNGVLVID